MKTYDGEARWAARSSSFRIGSFGKWSVFPAVIVIAVGLKATQDGEIITMFGISRRDSI